MLGAVNRLQPSMKTFRSLACVAPNTANGDVLWREERQVIDDVFPRCSSTTDGPYRGKLVATVNANEVAAGNVDCKLSRNSPLIVQRDVRGNGVHAVLLNVCRKTCGFNLGGAM